MATNLFSGRCQDCFEILERSTKYRHPNGQDAILCPRCSKLREHFADNQPPLGLPALGEWVDAGKLVVKVGGQSINVEVKYLPGDPEGEMKRVRFPNKPNWLPGGIFGRGKNTALTEAKGFMRIFYFRDISHECEIIPI